MSIELSLFGPHCHRQEPGYTSTVCYLFELENTRDMYLKSLHIQGFKTFEQSTTLELSYPIIAIVGPNGSGKSNLVDALRWTLCEQNLRTLRARSMLDLIFAGSATRRPVSYAEAEVVFNNPGDVFGTGGDTVTVARRIFRSKESDFLIDGKSVQLRDVEAVLTSTGLGFRHYPFIGQGEMSRIFTMKPEERKTLFEEVAGVSEYKQRKRDTLIKLEETRVNIARVEDLMTELNGNYAHLAQQAAAAREYVGYQARLHDLDLDIAYARYRSVLREQERATARLAEAQDKMAEVIGSLNSRQAAHDDLQVAQRKLAASLREKATALSEAREDAYRLEKELVSVREKAKYLAAEESRLIRQEQDWDASREQTARLAAETGATIEQLRAEEARAGAELSAEQHAYDQLVQSVEEKRKGLTRLQAEVVQLEAEVRQLFGRFNPLQFELDEKRKTVEQAISGDGREEPHGTEDQLRAAHDRVEATEARLRDLRAGSEEASRELLVSEQEQNALEVESRDKLAQAESYRTSLRNAAAFVASLEAQIRNGSTVRRVLDVVDLGERRPLLLQLLREELVVQLSDASGDALAASIRSTGQASLAMRHVPQRFPGGTGDVLAASVAAEVSAKDAPPIVRQLLQRLFVMKSLEEGLLFAREHPYVFYKVYTEDGFAIDSAFVVRALRGSIERSLVGKDSVELSRLESAASEAVQRAQEQKRSVVAAREKRGALLAAIQQAERDLKQAQVGLQAMVVEEERRRAVEHERASRLEAARTRILELEKEVAPLRDTLADRRTSLAKAREALDVAEKGRQKAEAELLAGKDRVQALQIRHNSVTGRIQGLLEKRLAYEDQLASLGTEIKASRDGLVRVRAERVVLEQRMRVLDDQFKEKNNGLAVLQAGIDQLEVEKRHKDEEVSALAAEIEGVSASRTRLEGRVRELEVVLAEGKGKLEQFTVRDDFAQLAGRSESGESLEQMQSEMDQVRRSMTNLEPVNMASISESEELAQRIAHLKAQDDDLVQSRAKLLALIDDLDRRASTLFEETFAVIEKAFQENFIKMFDGGEARLVRQENGELTGIDIDVVLPGKRRQPLELLSGGEKVLTAAALQFALFKARPSLFYLLDEVDNALDEDNVHRFARLLREQEDSQFLVVTHNRETMLAADVLYGVTMQESGVSKVVSLRLDSDEVPVHAS
ncbi:chromosome segregation protein SMC [bacterium]|nr:chromosome segregation protein SMC [bacterium]